LKIYFSFFLFFLTPQPLSKGEGSYCRSAGY
jgi:hypothetical protein